MLCTTREVGKGAARLPLEGSTGVLLYRTIVCSLVVVRLALFNGRSSLFDELAMSLNLLLTTASLRRRRQASPAYEHCAVRPRGCMQPR